ncbi:MAG: hypothetical protein RIT45_2055 [Pseudomonadota bacterium]
MSPSESPPASLVRFRFEPDLLASVVGGKSAIDLPQLRVSSREEAASFLGRYGFDVNVPTHVAAVERLRADALGFIRGVLLAQVEVGVPERFDQIDILDMMVLAGCRGPGLDHGVRVDAAWACSILRVMHTFAHAENYFQQSYYPQIRSAILERFIDQVRTLEDGSQVLVGRTCDVPLYRFEVKEAKPIRSVVLKLLHKEENVAADLFDHIGVRIIVERPVDALFAVRALVEEHTVIFANIKPTRSRNTLVDTAAFGAHVDALIESWRAGAISEAEAAQHLATFEERPSNGAQLQWNRHSSERYNSIQFTCRQLIRMPNPLYERLEAAEAVARATLDGAELGAMEAALDRIGIEREIQFFFPYEVQLMDVASFEAATRGRASYREYKSRQVATVRRRVLGRVLELMGVDDQDLESKRALRTTAELRPLREMLRGR